jgi:hypothetical protein
MTYFFLLQIEISVWKELTILFEIETKLFNSTPSTSIKLNETFKETIFLLPLEDC